MFSGKTISDKELKLFDVPKDMPLDFIKMSHMPVTSQMNWSPSGVTAQPGRAEALPTERSEPKLKMQANKSASFSMPPMTVTGSATQFPGGAGDGLPETSGASNGSSTNERNETIDENTKEFQKVRLLECVFTQN